MVYFNELAWQGDGAFVSPRENNLFYRKRWPVVAAFFYLWGMVGFFTGTGVLIGPARWVTVGLEQAGFGQKAQDHAMQAVMLLFLFASAAISLWLLRRTIHGTWRARMGIPAVCTALAMLSLYAWLNPGRMLAAAAGGGDIPASLATASGARFVFGAYPDEATLRKLKHDGVTAVISLQHPAVLPFEPASIETEKKAAARVGVRFIHAAMLPWVSDNREALEKIRQIAHSGRGVYYVHCGLGRDRTNVVRRMLEAEGVRTAMHTSIARASTFADRLAIPHERHGRDFQRGAIRQLEPGVWLIPYPNPAEMAGYLEAGQVKQVVLLLDPNDAQQKAWRDEAQRALGVARVPVLARPLMGRDLPTAQEIAVWVRTLPRPVAVVAPRTPFDNGDRYPGTEAAGALMDAYAALAPAPAGAVARR
ncbi:MAG TPA: hypothetical protein VJT67_06790 [Longimicrobiaceae bacterium]|nr:hypothetical protein [Longimicrobiaceae bacterium]